MPSQPDELHPQLKLLAERIGIEKNANKNGDIELLINQLNTVIQRHVERAENSEYRLRQIVHQVVEAMPVGMLITNDGGKIEAANPACKTMFRCEYAALVGHTLPDFFLSEHEIGNQEFLAAQIGQSQPLEVTAQRPDGGMFPADVLIRSFSLNPSLPKLLVVVEDVTARHEVERMKEEFVSMISHDLRTPLTSIQCFLNMLGEGMYDENMKTMKEKARGIEGDATRLIHMISNLLDVQKMEAGRLQMFLDIVPCHDIITRSVQSVEALSVKRKVPITVGNCDKSLHVRADCDYTIQVLVNFLSNAIKFSPTGAPIELTVQTQESFAKIMVSDRGPGISAEFKERMFNRFEQAQVSDARVKGGTGLGLAICKAIIEEHGGEIGVESDHGSGSTFWFTLPRVII